MKAGSHKEKVIITGGLGYVGGRIAARLARQWQVLLTTRRPAAQFPPLPDGMQLVSLDLASDAQLNQLLQDAHAVIHLAATNEIDSVRDPQEAIKANIADTQRLLQAAEKNGVDKFVYFSTIHVYGSPLTGNIDETRLPRPVHPYSITHHAAEDFVLASRDTSPLDATVLRLSNSFGAPIWPGVNRWSLIANDLCRQAAVNGQLVLKTPGYQQRDFIALSDVAEAVAHLLLLDKKQSLDGLFNLGGQKSLRMIDMAQLIMDAYRRLYGRELPLIRPEGAAADEVPLLYRVDKLCSTGFCLESNFEAEIEGLLAFCKLHFKQEVLL